MSNKPTKPSEDSVRHFIDYTWKDIHHSRLQNWTGITVVTAFHIGILKVIEYSLMNNYLSFHLKTILLIFGALFCFVGFLITRKHQSQMYRRLGWISKAQAELGTHKLAKNKKDKIHKFFKRNFWTAGALMGHFYLLLMALDIIAIFVLRSI